MRVTSLTNTLFEKQQIASGNFLKIFSIVAHIEMKLGTHACNIISMTTTLFKQQRIASGNFLKNTFSLLELAKGSTHGDETWYTCVLHYFHDNYMFL